MAVRRNDIAEELNCPVCQDEFDDPRILPCGHCYCLKCVVQLSHTAGPDPFPCPECRKKTVLPSNDASLLPRALLAVRMKEKLQRQGEKLCSKHDEPMKLYCSDCKLTVCINCALADHSEHNYQLVDVAAQSFAKTVNNKRASLGKQKDALLRAREANKRAKAEVCEQEIRIVEKINSSFDKLLQILQRRRDELLTEASACINAKKTALESQEWAMSEAITQLDCIDKSAEDILINTETILERHQEVEMNIDQQVEDVSKLSLNPAAKAPNMSVEANCANELAAIAKSQCRIIYDSDTSKFNVTINGIQSTIDVMCPTMVTLNTSRSTQGTHGEAEVSVRFQHVTTHGKCDVYERGSGVFEFSYCGVTRGHHILNVEEHGKPVLGSPFSVLVTLPPNKLGNIIRVIEPLCHPTSMAISSNNLIICEQGSCPRLVVMDRFGQNAFYIKSEDIIRPNGIAVDQDGMIYVTDASSHSLLKFDKLGTLLQKTGSKGNQSGQFNIPIEVVVVNNELIYVADRDNHRIQVFDKNLKFCRGFGSYGSKLGELNRPADLAYSKKNGVLFICDSNNHRIQVFGLNGKPLLEFSDAGHQVISSEKKSLFSFGRSVVHVEVEKLMKPWNISLDKTETFLLVADKELGHILVFTTQGMYVSSISSKGSGRDQLQSVTRIAVDSDGYIYACDSRNNKIVVY